MTRQRTGHHGHVLAVTRPLLPVPAAPAPVAGLTRVVDKLNQILDVARHALGLILDQTAAVDPWLVALGTVLYLAAQAIRTRGWHTILRAAYPDATELRARDTCQAYLAGAGLNGGRSRPAAATSSSSRCVHRRIEGSSYSTLAATFLPETVSETTFGILLVAWALARGFLPVPTQTGEVPAIDVSLILAHPVISAIVVGVIALALTALIRCLRRAAQGFVAALPAGPGDLRLAAPLRHRRRELAGARPRRPAGLAGGVHGRLRAAGHRSTTVVLVMAAQGGGRIIPLAPASAGLRLAMLSYGFVEVTDQPVDFAAITAFTFGVGAVLLVAGLRSARSSCCASSARWTRARALRGPRGARRARARDRVPT